MLKQPGHLIDLVVCQPPTPADRPGGLRRGSEGKEDRQCQGKSRRVQPAEDFELRLEISSRRAPPLGGEQLGQNRCSQARVDEQTDTCGSARGGQNLADFRRNSLPTDHGDLIGHPADRPPRRGIQLEIEPGGKTHRAQHPQFVLGEPFDRIADRPDPPEPEVFAAADIVNHFLANRIEKEPIDREIAARSVHFGRAEVNVVGMATIGVAHVIAERGDLDLPGPRRPDHRDHAKGRAQREGSPAAEKRANLVWFRIRCHVVVLRLPAEQLVPDAAAGPIRQVTGLAKPADHVHGELPGFFRVKIR